MKQIVLNIASNFSKYPGGRYFSDGQWSGEKFRTSQLVPALQNNDSQVVVELDGTKGYGSSFLEEAFGGLIREENFNYDDLLERLKIESKDETLKIEIHQYLLEASGISEGQN